MVHAIPVTVPHTAWQTSLTRHENGDTREETHAVWRLEAQPPDGEWRVVNAGGIIQGGVEVVRGRFQPGETAYRVMWVPAGGGGSLFGQSGGLDDGPPRLVGGLRVT